MLHLYGKAVKKLPCREQDVRKDGSFAGMTPGRDCTLKKSWHELIGSIRPGDVIGFSADVPCISGVINIATLGWPFPPRAIRGLSHVGIVVKNFFSVENYLLESTTLCKQSCSYCQKKHDGQQVHALEFRLRTYPGAVWHYPLEHPLTYWQKIDTWKYVERTHREAYDYLGACDSRVLCCGWLNWVLSKPDLTSLFCSENVAALLHELSRFDDYNASRWNPNKLARYLVSRRITGRPVRLK